jgi:hypothetical protein
VDPYHILIEQVTLDVGQVWHQEQGEVSQFESRLAASLGEISLQGRMIAARRGYATDLSLDPWTGLVVVRWVERESASPAGRIGVVDARIRPAQKGTIGEAIAGVVQGAADLR